MALPILNNETALALPLIIETTGVTMNDASIQSGLAIVESSLLQIIITTTSGTELEIDRVCLWPKYELDQMNGILQLAATQGQGFSTGLGFIGGIGSVVAKSLVLGAVEGVISDSMQSTASRNRSTAMKLHQRAKRLALFFPVNSIQNIQDPDPSSWCAEYIDTLSKECLAYTHSGLPFIRVNTTDCSIRNIVCSSIEQVRAIHSNPEDAYAKALKPRMREAIRNTIDRLLVAEINPGGVAYSAGVRHGDILDSFNDTPITSSQVLSKLMAEFQGQTLSLVVVRDSINIQLLIKAGTLGIETIDTKMPTGGTS